MHEQLHFKIEQEYYKIFITMEKRRYWEQGILLKANGSQISEKKKNNEITFL